MTRPFILGVVGVLLLAAALGLNLMLHRRDQASAPEPTIAAAPPVAPSLPPGSTKPGPAPAGVPQPPSFDVVRIGPSGDVVIAGRAEPQAEVHVRDGEREIGTVTADGRGQWVLLPSEPLASGDRALSLRAQRPGEPAVESETVVVAVAPHPGGAGVGGARVGGAPPAGATAGAHVDTGAVVAPGNSLWGLARNRYGDGAQYQTIYQANRGQIRNPDLIYPGQVFVMPEANHPGR